MPTNTTSFNIISFTYIGAKLRNSTLCFECKQW